MISFKRKHAKSLLLLHCQSVFCTYLRFIFYFREIRKQNPGGNKYKPSFWLLCNKKFQMKIKYKNLVKENN